MKRTLHYGTAALGIVGTVIYTMFAVIVKQGFTVRGYGAMRYFVEQAGSWFMTRLHIPMFQFALVAAGLVTLLMAPLGLVAVSRGKGARAAGVCAGLALALFGVMLAVNGFLYHPFFMTAEAFPGQPLYTVSYIIDLLLMFGVLAANTGGIILGVQGFRENKDRDTTMAFLMFGTALVFAGSLMWQLFRVVLIVKNEMLFNYFRSIVPLGAPYVWLAAVHVRAGMLLGKGE